jgi:hypothetical protein
MATSSNLHINGPQPASRFHKTGLAILVGAMIVFDAAVLLWAGNPASNYFFPLVLANVFWAIYVLPSFIACFLKPSIFWKIFSLNLISGWSAIGWVISPKFALDLKIWNAAPALETKPADLY